MIVKSDSREVREFALNLRAFIDQIEDIDLERELLRAGADAVVIVSHRIKHQNEDAEGNELMSKSSERTGAYSKRYGNIRKEAGRRTDRVDLNMTGKMMGDYNLTEKEKRSVGVGFVAESSSGIADYLEEYYGNPIFVPSEREENDIMEDTLVRFEKLFDKI